jgi:putative ABC transport system permease protein
MILENIKIAFTALWANKLRSVLTTLGIIIGVAAVIMLLAMGNGVKSSITKEIESIGSNVLIVLPGKIPIGQQNEGFGRAAGLAGASTLTNEDKEALKKVKGVKKLAGVSIFTAQVSLDSKKLYPISMGADPDIGFTSLYSINKGRIFTQNEVDSKARVALLGATTAKDLFGDAETAVGQKVFINNIEFLVIGTIKAAAQAQLSVDTSDLVLVPISVAQEFTKTQGVSRILIQVASKDDVNPVADRIKKLLLERHNNIENFSVLTQEELLKTISTVLSLLTTLLAGIAAISLLVGGIGIMNIMLVSVTERTREIGIRKAVGATRFNILAQFLVEAVLLSLVGGGLGIGLASFGSFLISQITEIPAVVSVESVILAFSVSVAVGIVFGIAPAVRASQKDPVEALRYE